MKGGTPLKLSSLPYRINYLYSTSLTLIFLAMAIGMISYPSETIAGATSGLRIATFILLPSLLPFLILTEVLMGLGVVHFIGTLLEPLMRPIFRIPGMGAFAIAMSLSSGYLTGAIVTAKLRKDGMCSRVEAERLLSITNVSNPIFIFGAVSVGMFHSPQLGLVLALSHYSSCILVGLIFRFYGKSEENIDFSYLKNRNIFIRAFQEMYQTRLADGRPLGQLLGDSVHQAINNMFLISGFLILFSVMIKLLTVMGIVTILSTFIGGILSLWGFSPILAPSMVNGFMEVTLGSTMASQAVAPLWQKIVITSGIIAWSGLSVQAQVASIVSRTDIRLIPYLAARILHAVFAVLLSFLFIYPLNTMQSSLPTLAPAQSSTLLGSFSFSCLSFLTILLVLLVLTLIFSLLQKFKIVIYKITK